MSENKKDLTRIEDLGDFLHKEDEEVNAAFSEESELPDLTDLSDLDGDQTLSDDHQDDSLENDDNNSSHEESDFAEDDLEADDNNFSNEEGDLSEDNLEDDDNNFSDKESDFAEDNLDGDNNDLSNDDSGFSEDDLEGNDNDFSEDDDNDFSNEENGFTENDLDGDDNDLSSDGNDFSEDDLDGDDNDLSNDENDFLEGDNNDLSSKDRQNGDNTENHEIGSNTSQDLAGKILNNESEQENTLSSDQKILENSHHSSSSSSADNITQPSANHKKEDFSDLKSFGENITYGKVSIGGNPPFSLILKNITYQEDATYIKEILEEHGFLNDDSRQDIEKGIENGSLLISQISEYCAIFLAHKFRRLNLDLQCGLSEEIFSSKSYQNDHLGLISKSSLSQNRIMEEDLSKRLVRPEDIILSTIPTLQGYHVKYYINIISSTMIINAKELAKNDAYFEKEISGLENKETNTIEYSPSEKHSPSEMDSVYQQLSDDLREKAYQLGANAVIGISYSITPLIENSHEGLPKPSYRIVSIGNAVIVEGESNTDDPNPK